MFSHWIMPFLQGKTIVTINCGEKGGRVSFGMTKFSRDHQNFPEPRQSCNISKQTCTIFRDFCAVTYSFRRRRKNLCNLCHPCDYFFRRRQRRSTLDLDVLFGGLFYRNSFWFEISSVIKMLLWIRKTKIVNLSLTKIWLIMVPPVSQSSLMATSSSFFH